MSEPLLEIDGLRLRLGAGSAAAEVLRGVSFAVGRGEKLALVGESGSGKTVTALSILRLLEPGLAEYPGGAVRFEGRDLLTLPEPELRRVRGRDIAMIFQEPMTSLNPVATIGEQLMEPLRLHQGLDRAAARRRVLELLARTGLDEPERRFAAYPHMLSGGQRQRAMIAMALAGMPKLLIADEPTTALDVTIQAQILALLEDLQREFRMAVLLITHNLNLVRRFADRVAVMQDGRLVEQGEAAQVLAAPRHAYTRMLIDSRPLRQVEAGAAERLRATPRLVEAAGVSCSFPAGGPGWLRRAPQPVRAVDEVSVHLHTGETLGIVGESGSGKSTLGYCLLRLQACRGEIRFDGRRLDNLRQSQLRPLRRDFQIVFQDPYSSLSPRLTVEQIVGEGLTLHQPQLDRAARRARIGQTLAEVGLGRDMLARYPHEFSGGQRQRIAIARVLVLEPKLVLLDEPTSALDVSVQKQVLELLGALQRRHGMSYIFISHDLAVIRAVAHRVVVMRQGRVVEEGETESLFAAPAHPYTQQLLRASLLTSGE
jgi:microcin C transport system ATP-binding protein